MSSTTGLNSLATIIKRLEAATSRLEDIASTPGSLLSTSTNGNGLADEASANLTSNPSPSAPIPPSAAASPPVPKIPDSVITFDEVIIQGTVKPFVELTKSFAGANVIELASLIEEEYNELRKLLLIVASCRQPDQEQFLKLIKPLEASAEAIARAKESHRRDREWFTHLTVVSDGAPAVGWVTAPKPGPVIGGVKESVEYYGYKVINEFKAKDPKHVEWVKSFTTILEELRKFVMEYHATGLTWNPKGVTVEQFVSSGGASGSTPGGAPPPPPPPPPPAAPPAPREVLPSASGGGAAAVFAELNRGEEVTKGLRKVDKSEMTHKNPALRASSVVPASPPIPSAAPGRKPTKPSKPQALAGKKPSKFALEGNKWAIEFQENESSLVVENGEINQVINLFGCKNSTLIIKGKVNAITLVNCSKTSVLVDSVVSSISVTNSPSFALQITGIAPMIQIDSTVSGQIYLSKNSLHTEITTAKCSAINVSLPVEGEEDGVFKEQSVPEMLKTVITDGKLVTTVVEHIG